MIFRDISSSIIYGLNQQEFRYYIFVAETSSQSSMAMDPGVYGCLYNLYTINYNKITMWIVLQLI